MNNPTTSQRSRVAMWRQEPGAWDSLHGGADHTIDVSLIIGTRDRSQRLARFLESVRRLKFERRWEFIIVDNGSVDKTAALVEDFIAASSIPVAYVFEPRPGLGNAHNAGLRIARGEILAFTDDDCYPAPDFLCRIWSGFEDVTLGYITGRIMFHDSTDYPITINESTTSLTIPAHSFIPPGDVQGANMAFRASVLRDIDGFDPLFEPGSLFNSEDLDVAARASALGWRGDTVRKSLSAIITDGRNPTYALYCNRTTSATVQIE